MKEVTDKNPKKDRQANAPHTVRLPGFVLEEDVGLGNLVKQVTSSFGIRPCGGCKQRAAKLNRWLVFTGKRHQ
ncbi:MAG TPA: hypothetical protein VMS31_00390 [Pyrinomonadaceae bacterium]|nr:hypothetical protein [Pyrinomonadaceae bacterium]